MNTKSQLANVKIVDVSTFVDERGALGVVEGNSLPFDIARIYFLRDMKFGASRGAHAHRKLEQLMICLSGSVEISLNDGKGEKIFLLNRANVGLYVPKMIWRDIGSFQNNAILLVLASLAYDPNDYIFHFDNFQSEIHNN